MPSGVSPDLYRSTYGPKRKKAKSGNVNLWHSSTYLILLYLASYFETENQLNMFCYRHPTGLFSAAFPVLRSSPQGVTQEEMSEMSDPAPPKEVQRS